MNQIVSAGPLTILEMVKPPGKLYSENAPLVVIAEALGVGLGVGIRVGGAVGLRVGNVVGAALGDMLAAGVPPPVAGGIGAVFPPLLPPPPQAVRKHPTQNRMAAYRMSGLHVRLTAM